MSHSCDKYSPVAQYVIDSFRDHVTSLAYEATGADLMSFETYYVEFCDIYLDPFLVEDLRPSHYLLSAQLAPYYYRVYRTFKNSLESVSHLVKPDETDT